MQPNNTHLLFKYVLWGKTRKWWPDRRLHFLHTASEPDTNKCFQENLKGPHFGDWHITFAPLSPGLSVVVCPTSLASSHTGGNWKQSTHYFLSPKWIYSCLTEARCYSIWPWLDTSHIDIWVWTTEIRNETSLKGRSVDYRTSCNNKECKYLFDSDQFYGKLLAGF